MSFTITKPLIDTLRADVELGRDSAIQGVLTDLHPADIAAVLDRLQLDEAVYVYRLLESEEAADVLLELNEDRREDLLNSLTSREIAEDVLEHIDSDDAADVMGDLSEDKQREVIALLEDQEQREDIEELLSYKEGTAGALMAKELVSVRTDWSVARAIVEMRRQAQEVDHVYTVYVVDKDERLAGILPLKDLLFGAESTRTLIKHLIEPEVVSVNTDTDVEEVVQRMKKYDAVVLPVVDTNGLLVGRITFDDVMDVMTEEAEEDYQLASGISEDVDATDSPLVQLRARLPWLLIGMVGGIVSSRIIAQYEGQLRIDPTMAFFMPLIAATAGNVGVQSSAIVVQGLASGSMGNLALLPRMWKELRVAVLSATVCAAVIFGINLALQQSQALTYTVSIALFSVILTAAMFGTVIPLLLNRLKVDPALATGPFVTTLNDIIGLLTYFTVGHFMYDLFPDPCMDGMKHMRIGIAEIVHPELAAKLTRAGHTCIPLHAMSAHDRIAQLSNLEGIVVRSRIVDAAFMDQCSNLRFVGRVGAGIENIDAAYCRKKGIHVLNSPEGNRDGVGESCVMLLLALMKLLVPANMAVRAGLWPREALRGTDLRGKTVGIIGFGQMGSAFAEKLRGFGVRVLGHDKYRSGFARAGLEECELDEVLRESDVISFHLPLNGETRYYANAAFFARLKKPVRVLNTSRGAVLNTRDLLDAIDTGKVIAAALDVLEFERPELDGLDPSMDPATYDRLIHHDRVLLTPHIAGVTHEGKFKMADVLADKILHLFPNGTT